MATSGIQTWELDRDELIEAAFGKIGIPGEGNTLTAAQYTEGATALNGVVTLLQTHGMPLWKRTTTSHTPSVTTQVYTLTAAVKVVQVVLLDDNGSQYDLIEKSRYDFNRLPSDAIGTPVHYTVQPTIGSATVSIWPLVSDATTVTQKTISVVYQKKFDGFTASGETLDFPSYWTLPIIYSLAVTLAPTYGLPLADRQLLTKERDAMIASADGYGDEDGSLFIQPDYQGK